MGVMLRDLKRLCRLMMLKHLQSLIDLLRLQAGHPLITLEKQDAVVDLCSPWMKVWPQKLV